MSSALQSRFGEDSSCDYEQDVKSVAATAFVGENFYISVTRKSF